MDKICNVVNLAVVLTEKIAIHRYTLNELLSLAMEAIDKAKENNNDQDWIKEAHRLSDLAVKEHNEIKRLEQYFASKRA